MLAALGSDNRENHWDLEQKGFLVHSALGEKNALAHCYTMTKSALNFAVNCQMDSCHKHTHHTSRGSFEPGGGCACILEDRQLMRCKLNRDSLGWLLLRLYHVGEGRRNISAYQPHARTRFRFGPQMPRQGCPACRTGGRLRGSKRGDRASTRVKSCRSSVWKGATELQETKLA